MDRAKMAWRLSFRLSSHTSEARDLKIGLNIPQIDGSKVTYQNFDILLRSWDI